MVTERLRRWLPLLAALIWAGVIFSFSSIVSSNLPDTPIWEALRNPSLDAPSLPDAPSLAAVPDPDVAMWEWITRKGAHILTFGVLGFLVAAAAAALQLPRPGLTGWVVATLYGAVDEAHQAFVPGRTAQATDVLIDAIGALLGVTLWWYLARRRRRPIVR